VPIELKKRNIIHFFGVLYLILFVLKVFVILENSDFSDINGRNIMKIESLLQMKTDYSFIAVGNVMNSIGIFKDKMIPMINASDADFVVFTGNAVLDGSRDKYASLNRMLHLIQKPALITFGDREASDNGTENYFKYIGNPYFFFTSTNSLFIFMDTTGFTEEGFQLNWLNELLGNFDGMTNRVIFMSRPLLMGRHEGSGGENEYIMGDEYKTSLLDLFQSTHVTAVISSSNGYSQMRDINGTKYISTGGGGGVIAPEKTDIKYYYTVVKVADGSISTVDRAVDLKVSSPKITFINFIWNKLYSWVYLYFINIILVLSLFFLVIFTLYNRLVLKVDYYPDFNNSPPKGYPLTIAMFTNNYLPFIGGVPLSIVRLKQGLEEKGHKVYIFAPGYRDSVLEEDESIIRCAPLFHYRKGELIVPVSNIFSRRIRKEFRRINPDIVHVHHPFWLGSVGRRLAAHYHKPAVFTYHTRLEQYNHYVPFFHRLAGGQIPHLVIKHFASECDAVIAPTSSAKSYLRNLGIGKLIVVQPTGIPLSGAEAPVPSVMREEQGLILFSVYRLSNEKSPFFMLQGIERLCRLTDIPFRCFIAGTGPEKERMDEFIREHSLEKRVVLLGKIQPESMAGYYRGADLFIFSSLSETQGMVILEAMAGGSPVVAVDSSGISDIVDNGKNGYKTEADLKKWVEKILYLIENPDVRLEMEDHALKTAQGYSLDIMCANILDMYYEIIDWKKKHQERFFLP